MRKEFIAAWKRWAKGLKVEVYAIYLAYQDPRVPWYARVFAACVVGYAFSPIDLIPDPIPVLGYLDDIILIPIGVSFARHLIPADVMMECRAEAEKTLKHLRPKLWAAAIVVIVTWLVILGLVAWWIVKAIQK